MPTQPSQPPRRWNRWLLVGLLILVGLALFGLNPGDQADRARRTFGREEFQTLVMGHTKEQLLKILGRPDRSQNVPDHWWYKRITVDPATGNPDRITTVWFTDNRVSSVEYAVKENRE